MNNKSIMPTIDLARKLIADQFPEYSSLTIVDVEKQGHISRYCHSRIRGNDKECQDIHGSEPAPGHFEKQLSNCVR